MCAGFRSATCRRTCSTGPGWRCATTPTGCASPPTRRSGPRAPAEPTASTPPTAPPCRTGLTSPTVLTGYLGLVSHMGFLRAKDTRRGTAPRRDEGKPAGAAFWADGPAADAWTASGPAADAWTASGPAADGPAANPPAVDLPVPDRRRAVRHAKRNPGHGGAGQPARASLRVLAFG